MGRPAKSGKSSKLGKETKTAKPKLAPEVVEEKTVLVVDEAILEDEVSLNEVPEDAEVFDELIAEVLLNKDDANFLVLHNIIFEGSVKHPGDYIILEKGHKRIESLDECCKSGMLKRM
jgi:hypothetical protein